MANTYRKKPGYEKRSPRTQYVIDCFAMFYSPNQVYQMLLKAKEAGEFLDEPDIKLTTVNQYRAIYSEDVKQRRFEIGESELPIIDPAWRYMRLQEIVEGAMEGETVVYRGQSIIKKDLKTAITAIAEVNRMTGFNGKNADEEKELQKLQRQVIEELRADLIAQGQPPEDVEKLIQEKFSVNEYSN